MSLLIFALIVLIVVGIVIGIVYQIPITPPMAWLRWVVACFALLIALVVILQKMGAI